MNTTVRTPIITIEPFDLKAAWPFEQEHHLVITAASSPDGMTFSATWVPVAIEPKGLVVARLDYQAAGNYMSVCTLMAPLFSCLLETNPARAGALINSTACLAMYLQEQTTDLSIDIFEQQYAGYEVSLMAE